MYVRVCLLLICSLLGDENIHNIDSINISAIVTDYSSNTTINRYLKLKHYQTDRLVVQLLNLASELFRSEVINFTVNGPAALEIGLPENFITYNYIATFLIENLSDSLEELTDREYTIEEVHSDDDGLSKLTVLDPHRLNKVN